ncbi:MAG: hypothetical protein AAE983_05850 [Thermoplasmataceae archaeon]|jgi:hypothetical protein|nr:hypothetical protein [Candidatus Thermoplasmatota archaeon]
MVNVIVEHRWKERDQEQVMKVVGGIVQMSKDGKLPAGFSLKSINVIGEERMAVCNWDAPSVKDMKGLLDQVNPPTKHEVHEATRVV